MDVAAKLGIIVDAAGARHEVMLTTAQLKGLSDGGKEAAAVMKELGIGLDDAGTKSEKSVPKVNALSESITRMRAAAAQRLDLGLAKQIADLDPFRLRTEQGAVATTKLATSMERMRAAGRQKADLGLAAQIEQLDPFQKKLAGVDEAAGHGRLSIGRLGNAVADLGAHLTGVHPILGKIVEVVGMFAVGHALTLGVIAGITLIAFAWDKYSEKVRKATEEQDKLVASSMEALRTRALGPGGEFANVATAAAGRISDLQTQREEATSIMGRDIRPAEQRERIRGIDSEISQLQLLIRDSMRNLDLAKAKQFADSITTPFDYAVARGQSILGFYAEAIASQRQLNDLAKSGDFATRTAAIQGLQAIQHVLDQIELQKRGLAEKPSTTLGLPSQVVVPGLQQTSGAIGGAFKQLSTLPVELLHKYENEINDLEGTINKFQIQAGRALEEHKDDWSATGQAIRQAAKDAQTFYDAVQVALHPERAGAIGAGIRGAQRDNGAMAFVQNNEQYGAQMAAREAALKLPPVFDAVREHAVRHGEAMRDLTNEYNLAKQNFASMDNALGSFKEGLMSAVDDLMNMISPASIGKGLLGGVISTVTNFAQGLLSKASEGIRHALFGSTSEQRAAAAAQRDAQLSLKLTLDSLRAGIKGDSLAQQLDAARQALIGLLKQINDALPGTKNESERNRQRAEAQALEQQQEQQLRDDDARRRREASEDLKVRLLRAQGNDEAADALDLANRQQREYNQAVKDGADAAYLAMLTQVQAAEKTKAAMDSLQDSIRNAPTGFRPEDYGLGQVMPTGGGGITLPTTISHPFNPFTPPRQAPPDPTQGAASQNMAVVYVTMEAGSMVIDGRENPDVIASKAVAGFRRFGAGALGPNAPLSKVIELMPASRSVS